MDEFRTKLEELLKAIKESKKPTGVKPVKLPPPPVSEDHPPRLSEKDAVRMQKRDPEKGMPETPASPKATSKPMGANAKPVLARRHKTDVPRAETSVDAEAAKPYKAHAWIAKAECTGKQDCQCFACRQNRLAPSKSTQKGKLAKNGQWSLD